MKISNIINYLDVKPSEGRVFWKKVPSQRVKLNQEAGSLSGNGYWHIGLLNKSIKRSRLIFFYVHGYLPQVVDHVNGDTQDDRIENLRGCSTSENMMNQKVREDNTSSYKGVSWNKAVGKWHSYINKEGKRTHLGFFDNKEDARKRVEEARVILHSNFARQE